MQNQRNIPSVRKVARRIAHILRQGENCWEVNFDGEPVVSLTVKHDIFMGHRRPAEHSWWVCAERAPGRYERYSNEIVAETVIDGRTAEELARDLLQGVRWDAEDRRKHISHGFYLTYPEMPY